jgi:hypothetical protein
MLIDERREEQQEHMHAAIVVREEGQDWCYQEQVAKSGLL